VPQKFISKKPAHILDRDLVELAIERHAGIVDKQMHAAMRLVHRVAKTGHGGEIGDVDRMGRDPAGAIGLRVGGGARELFRIDVGKRQ
jgi:hypothetical protein